MRRTVLILCLGCNKPFFYVSPDRELPDHTYRVCTHCNHHNGTMALINRLRATKPYGSRKTPRKIGPQ